MATVTLILGKSGSGKSSSLRNLSPAISSLIQVIPKPLPFRDSKAWKPYVTDNWQHVIARAQAAAAKGGRKIIIIDDFQYILANEFMRRSEEKGFDKFTEIGRHTWNIFEALLRLRPGRCRCSSSTCPASAISAIGLEPTETTQPALESGRPFMRRRE